MMVMIELHVIVAGIPHAAHQALCVVGAQRSPGFGLECARHASPGADSESLTLCITSVKAEVRHCPL